MHRYAGFHPGIHCLQNNSLRSYRSTKGEGDDFVAVDPLIVVTPLMYVFRGGGGWGGVVFAAGL